MDVEVSAVVLTSRDLRLGLVVRGDQGSWVRFVQAVVPLEMVPWEAVALAIGHLDDTSPDLADEALW